MKKKMFQKVVCLMLSVTLLLGAVGITSSASLKEDVTGTEKYPYTVPSLEQMKDLVGVLSYAEYLENFGSLGKDGLTTLAVDILTFDGNGTVVDKSEAVKESKLENPTLWKDFGSENGSKSVYLPATGESSWQIKITADQAGLYYIKMEYFNCITDESSISSIERGFKIDGKVPFDEVKTLSFNKNWRYDNITVTDAEGEADDYKVEYEHVKKGDNVGYYKKVISVKNGKRIETVYKLSQDINGNSMAPATAAYPAWNTYFLQDSTGYYSGYFSFYFAEGTHSITLEAERDPMIIRSIELVPATGEASLPSYTDVLAQYEAQGYAPAEGGDVIRIEAEFPDMVSDSSVNPSNDNTSAITKPISSSAQLYNVIGETSYSSVGQWAAYNFQVTKSGLYNLGMRFKQDALQGMYICRTLKLSGGHYGLEDGTPTVPFMEAYNTEFNYDKEWQSTFLGDGNRTFMFYFQEGVEYTLYLECSLGTLKNYIKTVEESVDRVNAAYLKILQLTGTDPDKYRDYNFVGIMPEVLVTLLEEAIKLMEVKDGLEELCGTNGSHIATLETVAILLNTMGSNDGDDIAANMSTLKSYLGTLGSWVNSSKRSSMMVDSIWVTPTTTGESGDAVPNEELLPKATANFFQSTWHEIKSFVSSFFTKYDQMGLTVEPNEDTPTIDVWLATGRDQSQIWRTMIDAHAGFTDSTGTAVALKLVTAGTLLPSILSGKGPDVYMGLGAADVINYAIRDAVIGVSGNDSHLSAEDNAIFSGTYYTYKDEKGNITNTTEYKGDEGLTFVSNNFADSVKGNFADAAMDTVTLLDVTYGIPQTMSFAMMFYRMDVLADLGQEIPESWHELLALLPVLQTNNMSIGVAYISALDFMIYQKGGNMWKYTDESKYSSEYAGARIDLDSDIALEAFEFTCRLYSDYSFPVSFDASNRFRTGEMPIVIGDYGSIYNTLTVYATEIQGLWGFCSLPGSTRVNEDGSTEFNYDSLAGVTATVLLHGCDNMLAAWQFTQWQTGEDAQADYGNRMVALIGPSAKYETANLNAIDNLSWTASEKQAIKNQMEHISSIVNYPGSYIITRYMQFAFLNSVNDGANPYDAMTGYIDAINSEIWRKRAEFDLWTPQTDDEEPPMLDSSV